MSPLVASGLAAVVIGGYVLLSVEMLATYTSHRPRLARWMRPEPVRRRRRFLWLDLPVVVLLVAVANLLMLSLVIDSSQPTATQLIGLTELVLAAFWSLFLLARLVRVGHE